MDGQLPAGTAASSEPGAATGASPHGPATEVAACGEGAPASPALLVSSTPALPSASASASASTSASASASASLSASSLRPSVPRLAACPAASEDRPEVTAFGRPEACPASSAAVVEPAVRWRELSSPEAPLPRVAAAGCGAARSPRGSSGLQDLPAAKRPRPSERPELTSSDVFGASDAGSSRLWIAAHTATAEWRIEDFSQQRERIQGACLDGPKFGPRDAWQVFCHPDGRCFNLPQGGPPGVFLRYLGSHERVPAYATIEKLCNGQFRVPENNARDSPFVVLFGRSEIEEWGVCKDFGLFDDSFCKDLQNGSLVLRARVTWIEPRVDSLLPREVSSNVASGFGSVEGSSSLASDLAALWAVRGAAAALGAGPSGGPAEGPGRKSPPGDVVLIAEGQRFEADRALLAARSAYFNAMLSGSQFREARQHEVELPDVSARSLNAVLRFIYTDESPDLRTCEEAEELLATAARLNIPGLLRLCSDCLRDAWLTLDNVVGLLRLGDQHCASSLRSEALAVVAANFDHVKALPEWEELIQSGMNPMLIQDMLGAVQAASIFAGRASIKL